MSCDQSLPGVGSDVSQEECRASRGLGAKSLLSGNGLKPDPVSSLSRSLGSNPTRPHPAKTQQTTERVRKSTQRNPVSGGGGGGKREKKKRKSNVTRQILGL